MPVTTIGNLTAFNKKIRRYWKKIQKTNKGFKRASKAEKRVLVAQDAIDWVKRGLINPTPDRYLDMGSVKEEHMPEAFLDRDLDAPVQLHEQILDRAQEGVACDACGLGGLLVAFCLRFDDVKYQEDLECTLDLDEEQMEPLNNIFDGKQLGLIETAFECWGPGSATFCSTIFGHILPTEARRAANFGNQYDDEKRFLAIMENIVRNKGTFKP